MDLNNLKTKQDIKLDNDYTGSTLLESGTYKATTELAYITTSKGGAMALNYVGKTDTGAKITQQFWMTSGTAKGGKNTFTDKQGNEQYLPGFMAANSLSLLTVGKEIADTSVEEKVINLYDYDQKKEVPTKVQMFIDLVGTEIIAGVQKQTVDKTAKNDANQYVPTGETRSANEVVKFFRAKDSLTVTEITAEVQEAAYIHVWTGQNEGKVIDKSTPSNGATAGAPNKPTKAASKTASLFS